MADPDAGRKAAEFPGYIDPTTLVVEHVTRDQQMFALWGELGYGDDSKDAPQAAVPRRPSSSASRSRWSRAMT
jgi:hypothetical protein